MKKKCFFGQIENFPLFYIGFDVESKKKFRTRILCACITSIQIALNEKEKWEMCNCCFFK
jgi:hypothetical protein